MDEGAGGGARAGGRGHNVKRRGQFVIKSLSDQSYFPGCGIALFL